MWRGSGVPYIKRSPGLRTNRGKVKDNRRSAREIAEPAGKTNSPLGLSFPMEPRSFVDVPAWTVPNRNTRCHRGLNSQAARRGRLHREAAISAESPSAERNPDRPNARPGFLYIEAPAQWLRTGASRLGFLCGGDDPPNRVTVLQLGRLQRVLVITVQCKTREPKEKPREGTGLSGPYRVNEFWELC